MKALSIKQPWAELIASGRKTIELRTWQTKYRGPLLICASAKGDQTAPTRLLAGPKQPLGVAVAVVNFYHIRPSERHDVERSVKQPLAKHFSWMLQNARRIEPFPVKGRLGLFEVDVEPRFLKGEM